MLSRLRSHLTYANVVSSLCLFIVLGGGTAYAAKTIGSKQIANNSVQGKDIKNGSITGKDVRKKSLTARLFRAGQLPRGATGPQGPAGPQGAAGATSVVVRERVATYMAEQYNHVGCATGERATGGGVANPASTFFQFGNEDRMVASAPSGVTGTSGRPLAEGDTPTGWTVGMNGTGTYSVTIYVVCVRP